ncbi:MAG: ABC transporter ATP-binding protein [Alphaproteobacteria bacterium]|nr:ABC transporter ATP-binding protein [Alphaproteobacteria bacterium]
MLKLTDLRKVYRAGEIETNALDGVNLTIGKGEFVAVMGPSGCGKSTLLNILGMIDKPTSGKYELDGIEISKFPEGKLVHLRKQHLGFVFQSFNLIDGLSVRDNVALPLLYCGVSSPERRERVREVLELVGLNARAKHKPAQLSGGQQQRVAIARAVVNDPKLILADEPTGNLDTKYGREVMDMLHVLHQHGATIVMVTHSHHDAREAGRIIHMLDGKVVSKPAEELMEEAALA